MNMESIEKLIQAAATIITALIAIIALWRQQKQAIRLKIVEAELNKANFEHQTMFAKLHEKRAGIISELFEKVIVLEIWLNHIVAETELPDEVFTSPKEFAENFESVFGKISINLQKLAAYYNLNRLYFSEEICQKLLEFHEIILEKSEPVYDYFYKRFETSSNDEGFYSAIKDLKERSYDALQKLWESRKAIEYEFRKQIGIEDEGCHLEGLELNNTDLMWIPEPRIMDPIE